MGPYALHTVSVAFTALVLSAGRRKAMEALHTVEMIDAGCPRLRARCMASGAVGFTWQGRVNGRVRTFRLGFWGAMTIDAARAAAVEMTRRVREDGYDPVEDRRGQ